MRLIKLFEDRITFPPIKGFSGANYIYKSGIKRFVKSRMYGYYFDNEEDIKEPLYLYMDKLNNCMKAKLK